MYYSKFENIVRTLVDEGRLKAAMRLLKEQIEKLSPEFPALKSVGHKLEPLEETYRYMSDFLLAGTPDDSRDSIHAGLKESILELLSSFIFIANSDVSNDSFFSNYRLQTHSGKSLEMLFDRCRENLYRLEKADELEVDGDSFLKSYETDVDSIFLRVLTLPPAHEETEEAARIASGSDTPYEVASQIVSALMLGCLKFYDPRKLSSLLDIYEQSPSERIQARALYAIVAVISCCGDKVASSPRLTARIENLTDSIMNYMRIRDAVMIFIRTRDTDRVNKKIESTFKETMQTLSDSRFAELRKNPGLIDPAELEENPEWQKLMEQSGLQEKMQSINEMQLEGMDVMMQAFAGLKGFPFFSRLSNWFLPFSFTHSAVKKTGNMFNPDLLESLSQASDLCGSDKFSFMLSLETMPSDRVMMIASQLEAAREQFAEELKSRGLKASASSRIFRDEMLGFARDLYRFMKLYPRRTDFVDIYRNVIDFCSLPGLGRLLSETEIVEMIGEFYFTYGYYSEALPLLRILEEKGEPGMELFEKIGYCHQVLGNHAEALSNYEKADLFSSDANPSSMWLVRKLALCNKILGRFDRASEFYLRALEREPENVSLMHSAANSLMRAGRLEEAASHLSRAHYLQPENEKILLTLVSLYLRQGDMEKAGANIEKLKGIGRTPASLRLVAAYEYLRGNMRAASGIFASGKDDEESKSQYISDMREFLKSIQGDRFNNVAFEIMADRAFS